MTNKRRKNINGASGSGTKNNDVVSKVGNQRSVVDFISSLPDDILTRIFSMLSTKEALSLCNSSRRFKHLSTTIPNVEIRVTINGFFSKFQSFSRFLENHDSVVEKFQLSNRTAGIISHVLEWLRLVVKDGIEEIDLKFDYSDLCPHIPASLLTAKTLKVLKLRRCIVDDLLSITGLKSLKSLLLEDMYISDDMIGLLCCHCESLQDLAIHKCTGFGEIKILNPRSKLETLILDHPYDDVDHFRLNISSLKTLLISNRRMNFSFIGRPHIDDLVLCRGADLGITEEESENMKVNIINKLGNVRFLQLDGWAFECLPANNSSANHSLKNLEVLALEFDVGLSNQTKLNNLIVGAKCLKTLLISIKQKNTAEYHSIYTDGKFERVIKYYLDRAYGPIKPTVYFGKNTVPVSSSTLQNINIKDFSGTLYEVSYINFVLAHFQHLRVFEVTPVEEMEEEEILAYAELFSMFPRVCRDVYMLVGSEEVWKSGWVR
ncbi:F-box protein At5g03100-like [Daucus carota subsp. sativus]|uniref:F-box protein At5g03100-like n=1 Tax=Daucus carota subsp. sativus TaxID=79200 RepID=UPI00308283E1